MHCGGNVAEFLDHPNFLNKPSCTQHDPGELLFGEKMTLQLLFFQNLLYMELDSKSVSLSIYF